MTAMDTAEIVPPPAPSLPHWLAEPEPVDPAGTSYLIVALGPHARTRQVAQEWVAAAEALASTAFVVVDSIDAPDARAALDASLDKALSGVRIMVVGGQYEVLRTLTIARDAGAIPAELSAFVVDTTELPLYCAHCRDTFRAAGSPGDTVTCAGCARRLEIHRHYAAALGSFLASEA
ncbi:dimethylamine monooxygenase subunit DmmA family protein [Streptomyces sp. NPDC050743]|uniref:dimethylamine monooxygenase subunit DmmA family protein n=1 Tax=Streptomyces sp. NPDC050743 TaxID=3365634 RepID=UPI0037A5219E